MILNIILTSMLQGEIQTPNKQIDENTLNHHLLWINLVKEWKTWYRVQMITMEKETQTNWWPNYPTRAKKYRGEKAQTKEKHVIFVVEMKSWIVLLPAERVSFSPLVLNKWSMSKDASSLFRCYSSLSQSSPPRRRHTHTVDFGIYTDRLKSSCGAPSHRLLQHAW